MTVANANVDIECPHCGDIEHQTVDALSGSGQVPKVEFTCGVCDKPFHVHVTIAIDVTADK